MDTYLLLRSNKQSGPYSLQQLVSFGLKPYDLVWIEGKSAAWRYPSEVDLLKDYAPATEEQPYDRFYKKQEEKPAVKTVLKQEEITVLQREEIYVPSVESKPVLKHEQIPVLQKEEIHIPPVENKTVTTSKKIFVSMPERPAAKQPTQATPPKAPVIVEQKPAVVEEHKIESKPILIKEEPAIKFGPALPKADPVKYEKKLLIKEETPLHEMPVPFKEEPTLNEKYSESLDDIKRRYTETYLSRKKKSKWTSTHTSLVQVFGGAIFFCFLVVFAYKNFSGEETGQSKLTIIQPDKRAVNTGTATNTPTTLTPVVETEINKQPVKKTIPAVKEEELNPPDESAAIKSSRKNEEIIKGYEIASADTDTEKNDAATKSTDDTKPEQIKTKSRSVNISRLVNVRANNYKQRAFGGVMNLELTVNNDSKFELDKVIVELQYLKPSEQPLKTERIIFNSIEANGSQTLKIPDYLRGVKVAYRVTEIESSQYDRHTAGL